MDNPENLQINPISDIELYSPNKLSKHNNNQLLDTQSPFQYKVSLFNTPNKLFDGKPFFPSYVNTPTNANYNINFPISPLNNDQKGEIPFQNSQNVQKNSSSIFKYFGNPFCTDKKNELKNINNRNEYYPGIRGINLNDKFNDVEERNLNEKNINENNVLDNNNKYEFINNIYDRDEIAKKNEKRKKKNNSNKKVKEILFGDDTYLMNNNKENIFGQKNNNNIDDKVSTFIVEESTFNDIKNVFGNNLSKKEYVFSSLNSSIISNFSMGQNEPSFLSQSQQNKNIGQSSQSPSLSGNTKNAKNIEFSPSYFGTSTNISSTPSKCTCKNSNCFKLYCECFANGKYCDNCFCLNCKNTLENKELRNKKYEEIISRNPKALQKINSTKRSWTCKCKNSNCLKKYCDCLQNGRYCTSKCKCINCYNKNNAFNRNNGNEKKNKIRRIRGIKNKTIMNKNIGDENENNTIEEKKEINNDKKKKIMNLSTPKKNDNYLDKDDIYIYYDKNEKSTAAMTNKKNRRKILETRTETKNKNIYTKLQMDNI